MTTQLLPENSARRHLSAIRSLQRKRDGEEHNVPEYSPMVYAAGKAKQLIEAAGMGGIQREITKRAGEVCGGDAECYLDYVKRAITEEQEKRQITVKINDILADLDDKVQRTIRAVAYRGRADDLPAVLAEVKRLASQRKAVYEVSDTRLADSFFTDKPHQHFYITFQLYSDDKAHNRAIVAGLVDAIKEVAHIYMVSAANVTPNGAPGKAGEGLPGKYRIFVWAKPNYDIYADVIARIKQIPAEDWR